MKTKITFLVLIILTVNLYLTVEYCSGQWIQTSAGMGTNKIVRSLNTFNNYIFAGVFVIEDPTGIWRSDNNGNNWLQVGLNTISVLSLASNGSFIFAGASSFSNPNNQGVWRSADNGNNWIQMGLNDKTVSALISDLGSPQQIVYAGTSNYGVYRSTDNGTSFIQWGLSDKSVYSIAISWVYIFAGTYSWGIFRTINTGNNWIQVALNGENVYALATSGDNVFAGTIHGVMLSTNNGDNWVQTSLNDKDIRGLYYNGGILYAGTNSYGIYISTNNGTTWTEKNLGFNPVPSVNTFTAYNNYIFTGTEGISIWRRPVSEIIGICNISSEITSEYKLEQNYPNPFNSMTNIKFQMLNAGNVMITVFDLSGREILKLVNEKFDAGSYEVKFDAGGLTSGIYFYQLITDNFIDTKKLILIK